MPICPKCGLGLPPTLTTCPDCGRGVVEIASVADSEQTQSRFVTTAVESDPVEGDADTVSVPIVPEVDDLPLVDDIQEPSHEDTVPDFPDLPEPEVIEDVAAQAQETAEDVDDVLQEERPPDLEEAVPVIEDLQDHDDAPDLEVPGGADLQEEREGDNLAELDDVTEIDEGEECEAADVAEVEDLTEGDNDEDDLEQFLAGAKRFTRIVTLDDSMQGTSVPDSAMPRAKPVRWTHRAYRGDVDVINAKSSRAVTLAVFGDGLLLVESLSGVIGGLVPALTGRLARKVVTRAGSSVEAAARLEGSRRLATPDIRSVRIAKGRGWARDLTIRTTKGEELQYRFASKRYRQVVSLLSPVLGPKLRDIPKGEKAPRRAG